MPKSNLFADEGFSSPKKGRDKKRIKMGEPNISPHTQVGEQSYSQPEPTHPQKVKVMAQEEMKHATRQWIAGHMSTKEHSKVHSRARHAMHNAHRPDKPMKRNSRGRG